MSSPRKILLRDLLPFLSPVSVVGMTDQAITGVCCDSRRVKPGNLFFALRGGRQDGNQYIPVTLEKGAAAVVTEDLGIEAAPPASTIRVEDARKSMALASAKFYGFPTRALRLVGITGTNGKTTTAYLLHSIFVETGECAGLIGTVEYRLPGRSIEAKNTTPESVELQGFFAELRDQGCRYAVMEVSSHALEMHRVDGSQFGVAVFTNLTRDHLDFHGTMDRYFEAKKKLFAGTESDPPEWAVINLDDQYGARLLEELPSKIMTYGIRQAAQVRPGPVAYSFEGLKFSVETPHGPIDVESSLVGEPNVYNILAAIAASLSLDIDMHTIRKGIRNLHAVPGRFEKIICGQPFAVVVDYAHTDDALRNVIQAARRLTKHRVITVFGCGGDRDRSKRPLMGQVAGQLSDLTILTSDNPRTEDPLRIIADAVVGLQRASHNYTVEPDRTKAIRRAIEAAREGDIVLLTGKGHETYQVIGERAIHFDDREVAREILTQMGYQPPIQTSGTVTH